MLLLIKQSIAKLEAKFPAMVKEHAFDKDMGKSLKSL